MTPPQLECERTRSLVGVPVVPITTGRACHLDAAMVERGLGAKLQRGVPADLEPALGGRTWQPGLSGRNLRWRATSSGAAQCQPKATNKTASSKPR